MSAGPVDMAILAELEDSMGVDFAAELIDTFLQEAPGLVADLKAAAYAGEGADLRRAAHSIKSNAAIFGAGTLAEIAREIETNGLTDGAVARLEAEYARAAGMLQSMLDG